MKKGLWLIRLVGIILFIYILARTDLSNILPAITGVNPWYLTAAVVLNLPSVFFKAWRWQFLLKMQGVDYSLRQAFPAYFSGNYLGLVTPGRVGELGKVFYLTNDKGMSLGGAFSSVLIDRWFDILMLVLVGGYGFVTFPSLRGSLTISVIILVLLLVVLFLPLYKRVGKGLLRLIYRTGVFGKLEEKVDATADQFYSGLSRMAGPRLVIPSIFTLVAYAIFFVQCYLLSLSQHLSLIFFDIAVYMAVVNLVSLIPVSIAGIGTRDAALIDLFSLQGISAASALSYSLLVLFTFYIYGAAIGAIAWQIKPIKGAK